ncbi:CLIP-associating protein 1 [Trichonephila clavipes]|uniref:CLIP-associating protein 1 n=1 Tax=Trichonephila clavipes TaxID=2585209 RepID=A0A8X6SUQ3_TRICX|nr:CLIP-associating protein 1 [Trichonephila clavipes]
MPEHMEVGLGACGDLNDMADGSRNFLNNIITGRECWCLKFGSSSLTISRLMPSLVKLLADPNSQVRDTAMATLVHVYKHVGERLRHDISKRAGIPPPKMQLLFTKFDEVKNAGNLLPSAMERSGRFVLGTFRFERMRVLNRSRQDDRLRVMLVLVHIDMTHSPANVSANKRTNDTIFVASM